MKRDRIFGLVLATCLVIAARPVWAQETINSASVSGRVTDSQGGVLPGAHVTARQTETNISTEALTDANGRFRFPYLKVGPYEVKAHLQGFADNARELRLTVGSAYDITLTLAVAGVDTNVTVVGEPTVLETARSEIAGTVPQAEVQHLPLNGRNFLDIALLIPGVSPTNTGSTQLFAETSAVPGQGVSIGSQRNFSNSFIVDGLSANDDAAGLSGVPYGVDTVEQFQVVTSGGQAELGRALGGYVNVVTRSGTNALHGTAYDFIRDDSFNAPNALSGATLPMNQQQWGASLGGPVVRNRTFYFANVEQRLLDQTGLVTIAPANVSIINAKLAAVGYPGSPISTGTYPNPVHSWNVLGKLDHQASGSDQLSVKYSFYDVRSDNSRGAGALNASTASAGLDNTDQAIAFSNTRSLGSRAVNETRAQVVSSDLSAPPSDPIGPAVSITNIATFGTLSGSPTARKNTMVEVVDNLSQQAGAHALRAGVDVLYNDDTITFPRSSQGSYTFSSLANFLTGNYTGFSQTFGNPLVSQTNPNVGLYAQDEWRAGSRITLNLGLRYDLQYLDTVTTDKNNVSPRVGFAWSPSSSDKWIVRGSAGVFVDRVPLRAVANAILSAGNTTNLANLHQPNVSGLIPSQDGAPVFPNVLPAQILTTTLVDFTTIDPHIQNASSRQASLEVERELGHGRTLGVAYQYLKGEHLLVQVNQNVATCVQAGSNNGCRPNPAFRNNNQYSSIGASNYHGLHVSFNQRATAWASLRVSYTLSNSMNDVGEAFFNQPVDPTNIMRDWARSDDDQRHRVVVNGTINTPMGPATTTWDKIAHGFVVSGFVQFYSAPPFNITSGVTSLQGTTGRPFADGTISTPNFDVRTANLIPRNTGIGSDYFTLNLRVSREFRVSRGASIEAMAEAFNLTNRVNNLTRNASFGAGSYPANPVGTFNQITAVGDPRVLQFGLRLTF